MAKINKRVMDMVRREFAKNPDAKSGALYDLAKKLDRSIGSLTLRQFHARYPLQVKRAMKSGSRGRAAAARKAAPKRRAAGAKKRVAAAAGGRAKKARKTPRRRAVKAPSAPAATTADRTAIRTVLLDFASQVAGAENKAEMITVIGSLDGWVDRVVRAHG